eukprot:TRINITY_DN11412_c0_g1_i1.p1 TRINITY_DN11412_c0_g1~~TRINITY_DN11412_c0_g1_i1.p1  ORF type:complete len:992 (-),score=336.10 TRINITY_DN11412_c0_g1_i1:447-3422(-)
MQLSYERVRNYAQSFRDRHAAYVWPGIVLLLIVWELSMWLLEAYFPADLMKVCLGVVFLPVALLMLVPTGKDTVAASTSATPATAAAVSKAAAATKAAPADSSKAAVHGLTGTKLVSYTLACLAGLLIIQEFVWASLAEAFSAVVAEFCGVFLCMAFCLYMFLRKGPASEEVLVKLEEQTAAAAVPPNARKSPPAAERIPDDLPAAFAAKKEPIHEAEAAAAPLRRRQEEGEGDEAAAPSEPGTPPMESDAEEAEADEDEEGGATGKFSWADTEEDDEHFSNHLAAMKPKLTVAALQEAIEEEDAARLEKEEEEEAPPPAAGEKQQDSKEQQKQDKADAAQPAADSRKRKGGRGGGGDAESDTAKALAQIRDLGRAGDTQGAMVVVESAAAAGVMPRAELQNTLLHSLVQFGDPNMKSAQDLFAKMKTSKEVNVVSFNIMLRAWLAAGKLASAKALLKDMTDLGIKGNKVTLNELLTDRVKAGDRPGMWRIIEEMRAAGFGVNKVACSICLKSLTDATPKEEVKKTLGLLDELSEPVDDVLCSCAIEACLRINELGLLSEFMKVLDRISTGNTRPTLSAATYGSMIKAYGQARELKQIWAAWNAMQRASVVPSAVTLGCMVEALVSNNAIDDAWKLVHDTLENDDQRSCVNTVIYSTLLKGFAHLQQPQRCFEVLDEMRSLGIEANTITYNTLLDVCAKCGAMARVPQVFQEMKNSSVEPDLITYSTLVKGYCLVGDLDCAFELLEEMKRDSGLRLDEIVYNSLIDGCGRQQKVGKAMKVLEEMREAGVRPSNYTLSIMVKLLGRARRLDDAFALLEDFRTSYNVRPNIQVYTCLIQACILNKQVKRALTAHDAMVHEQSCFPDAKFYAVLVGGCVQAGSLQEAVQVARCAYRLPSRMLATAPERRGQAVGVENKVLQDLAAKLRRVDLGPEAMEEWQEVLQAASSRPVMDSPSGGFRQHHHSDRPRSNYNNNNNNGPPGKGGYSRPRRPQ